MQGEEEEEGRLALSGTRKGMSVAWQPARRQSPILPGPELQGGACRGRENSRDHFRGRSGDGQEDWEDLGRWGAQPKPPEPSLGTDETAGGGRQVTPHLVPPPCSLRPLRLPPQGPHGDKSRERLGGGPEWPGSSTGRARNCRHGLGGGLGRRGPGEAASGPVDCLGGLLLAEPRVPGGSGEAPPGSGAQPRHLRKGPAASDGRDAGAHGGCALEPAAGAAAPSPAPPHSAGDERLAGHYRSVIEGGPLSSELLCLGCKKGTRFGASLWSQLDLRAGQWSPKPSARPGFKDRSMHGAALQFGLCSLQPRGQRLSWQNVGFLGEGGCPPCL